MYYKNKGFSNNTETFILLGDINIINHQNIINEIFRSNYRTDYNYFGCLLG